MELSHECARGSKLIHLLPLTCYENPFADKYLSNLKLLARSTQSNFLFTMPH